MEKPHPEPETMLHDLVGVLQKVDPWTAENIDKSITRYSKAYIYTALAAVIQGKTKNYLPIAPSLEILGKEWMLKRFGWKE